MRIFVSGGTGVVGKRAVRLMIAQGHAVTVLVRSETARRPSKGVQHIVGGLFDRDRLERSIRGHEAVVNLATHMPSPPWRMIFRSAWRENDRLRTLGVANLVAAAKAAGAERFVQESFGLTYPDCGDRWVTEDVPLAPASYNATVVDAERSAASFGEGGGAAVSLRFAAFYGPDADQTRSYIAALRWGWAVLPGPASAFFSSISHDDAAAAVVAALGAPGGAYNVCDDEPVPRGTYMSALAAALDLRPPRFLPGWSSNLMGSVGDELGRSLRLSNRKLRETTGWSPSLPSVRQGWPAVIGDMRPAFATSDQTGGDTHQCN